MNSTLEYTPSSEDWEDYVKVINKIFPQKPLYIFLALTLLIGGVATTRHVKSPTRFSLLFVGVVIIFLILGACLLYYTRKLQPMFLHNLRSTIGIQQCINLTNSDITITAQGEAVSISHKKLIGQYCSKHFYIAYIATDPHSVLIIKITPENGIVLDNISEFFTKKGVHLKNMHI